MDPIIEGRQCSCCDVMISDCKTYIVSRLERGAAIAPLEHTSCPFCGEYNRGDYEEAYEQSSYWSKFRWKFMEFRTSDGKPLRYWLHEPGCETVGPIEIE